MTKRILLVALLAFPLLANAAAGTGPRKIVNIGCHTDGSTCYVHIAGSAVGPTNCTNNSVHWIGNDAGGKQTLAVLTAAFLAGKNVDLYITDNCYTPQPVYPTFSYYNVADE